jgi:hypothetical protein
LALATLRGTESRLSPLLPAIAQQPQGAPPALQGGQQGQPQSIPLGQSPPDNTTFPVPTTVGLAARETGRAEGRPDSTHTADTDGGLSADRLFRMIQSYEIAKTGERNEMWVARSYYHGTGQWTMAQRAVLAQRKQLPTYYNRIRRKVNFLTGTEQRLRRDPKAYPNHPKWDADSSAATHSLRFVQTKTDAPSAFSAASLDFFVQGVGVLSQSVSVTKGQADPTKDHVPAERFIYDPRSEKHDFSDAKFLGVWQWVETDTAVEMMESVGSKQAADLVRQLGGWNSSSNSFGGQVEQAMANRWVDPQNDSIHLVELYYRYRGQWRLAFMVGTIKLYDAPSTFLNEDGTSRHPFNAVSCEIDEQGDRYGIIRDMIPVQDQINHRLSKLLHLLSTRQLLYEKGSLADPNKARREFQKPDGMIELNPGALSQKRVQIEQATVEIQGQADLLQAAISELENMGPNPGLVGRGEGINTQSGRAILAQQNAGMTELSPVFERIRAWKLKSYKIDWSAIRQFWSGPRFIRVTDGREPRLLGINQMSLVEDGNGMFSVSTENNVAEVDVDIIVEEGPDTITVREEMMETFGKLGPNAVGPLGKILIELSNVPDKDKLLKMIDDLSAPPPEVSQLQQRIATLEGDLKQAQVGKAQADTAVAHANTENKRADTLVKLAGILAPPQALDQSFPRAFSDQPGVTAPDPILPLARQIPAASGMAPPAAGSILPPGDAVGGPPGAPPIDPGPNGMMPDGPISPLASRPPPLQPGDEPRLDSNGVLPLPRDRTQIPGMGPQPFA